MKVYHIIHKERHYLFMSRLAVIKFILLWKDDHYIRLYMTKEDQL